MNIFAILLVSILSLISVRAYRQDKKCARELQEITYVPKVCAFEYLKKITETLAAQGPLLFVPETAKPIFERFVSTFNVHVNVVDAFGVWLNYPGGTVQNWPKGAHSLNQAYALGEGFSNIPAGKIFLTGAYIYNKVLWNFDGQVYTVSVIADKDGLTSLTAAGCC